MIEVRLFPMRMKRIFWAVAAVSAGLIATAGPAIAAPTPPVQPFDIDLASQATDGPNGYCPDFAVHVHYLSASAPHGPGPVFAGPGSVTLTNLNSGKTLTYNASGPGTITSTSNPDTVTYQVYGPNVFWTSVGNSYSGVPQIAYTTGHLQFTYQGTLEEPGKTTAYSLNGKSTDVCAALQ